MKTTRNINFILQKTLRFDYKHRIYRAEHINAHKTAVKHKGSSDPKETVNHENGRTYTRKVLHNLYSQSNIIT
jgi:hypothetical protein